MMQRNDKISFGRGRRRVVALAVLVGCLTWGATQALADAGNPIVGATTGTLSHNADGSWTAYVKGQWNWLSHKTDCNFDRAGAGLAVIWNDPNEPGYTISNNGVTANVGVAQKLNGDTYNQIDGQVHPADIGQQGPPASEIAPGVAGQQFNDPPALAAGAIHTFVSFKGGCGGQPFGSSTWNPFGSHPFGSWGYDKNLPAGGDSASGGGQGYSHTYVKRSDITSICVNFYDVHGGAALGGKNFQRPNNSSEIDVLANHDNSIQTNAFNVNGNSCISFATISTNASNQTSATSVLPNGSINDTASITGGAKNSNPTVTFKAYLQDNGQNDDGSANGDGNGTPASPVCTTPAFTDTEPVSLDSSGNGSVGSAPFSQNPYLRAGTYEWIATLNPNGTQNAIISNSCGDSGEQSVVAKASPTMTTGQKISIHDVASITGFAADGGASTVDFQLFSGTSCSGTPLFDSGNQPIDSSSAPATSSSGSDFSVPFSNTDTTYSWLVSYSGDAGNSPNAPVTSTCGSENFSVAGNNLPSGVDP
jgi:hypothetical protein